MKPLRPVLAATTLLLLAAGLSAGGDASGDAQSIKGIWAVQSSSVQGVRQPDDPTRAPVQMAFDGASYVQLTGQQITEEGDYELDPAKDPKAIDFEITKGPEAGKRQLGIYRINGDTLTIALAEPGSKSRPRAFGGRARSVESLVVFRKVRP